MSLPFDLNAFGPLLSGFQQRLEQLKAEAAEVEVTGRSGGGLVVVTANGKLEVVSVQITPEAHEDRELLEDLVAAATNDALRQAREVLAEKVGVLTGGLPLPPGLLGF